jgi:hypothetical protein
MEGIPIAMLGLTSGASIDNVGAEIFIDILINYYAVKTTGRYSACIIAQRSSKTSGTTKNTGEENLHPNLIRRLAASRPTKHPS